MCTSYKISAFSCMKNSGFCDKFLYFESFEFFHIFFLLKKYLKKWKLVKMSKRVGMKIWVVKRSSTDKCWKLVNTWENYCEENLWTLLQESEWDPIDTFCTSWNEMVFEIYSARTIFCAKWRDISELMTVWLHLYSIRPQD